jgi:hypothetical protein
MLPVLPRCGSLLCVQAWVSRAVPVCHLPAALFCFCLPLRVARVCSAHMFQGLVDRLGVSFEALVVAAVVRWALGRTFVRLTGEGCKGPCLLCPVHAYVCVFGGGCSFHMLCCAVIDRQAGCVWFDSCIERGTGVANMPHPSAWHELVCPVVPRGGVTQV